jgi:hypothetical protein
MKLIYCPECQDIVRLFFEDRSCRCGKSHGMYRKDGLNAIIGGYAIPIGIDNHSWCKALETNRLWYNSGDRGVTFEAFIIPKKCKTVERP